MINLIRSLNAAAEIILQTMNPTCNSTAGGASGQGGALRPNLAAYFQAYRDVVADHGLLLIDNDVNWLALHQSHPTLDKTYVADGVHPNDAGYAAIVRPTAVLLAAPMVLVWRRKRVGRAS